MGMEDLIAEQTQTQRIAELEKKIAELEETVHNLVEQAGHDSMASFNRHRRETPRAKKKQSTT